ncbi:hypothetical protein BC937DRAFT_95475 [Endogone sp. FLAS-F59071]|nr:hypothetical protein BC937DRAFT_95475 [Endogone sp. FLAS-F59071]|eukprot:RUS20323.1 hypothetical protein BC937DRAFT_95475 [Endogone sp. FLAS-F59071]
MSNPYGPEYVRPEGAFSRENFLKEMDTIPLFMTRLPEDADDNPMLSALQSLKYDGTPEEVAENFKNQGNDSFKQGKSGYQDAVKYYTQALETNCNDVSIIEACYANRAAVNLELQNYGMVLKDCAKCLGLNPRNIKALYRSARALYALDRCDEAIDCCDHGLAAEPTNLALKAHRERCVTRRTEVEEKRKVKEDRERKELERQEALAKAIESRNIKLSTTDPAVLASANITFDPATNTLSWPVFLLYPEHKESDHIQAFSERDTLQDHLDVVFEQPAPWDRAGAYTPGGVEVYFETNTGLHPGLVKVGKRLTLGEVLGHPKCVVQNGVPSFIVLPKTGGFKDEFLARKDIGRSIIINVSSDIHVRNFANDCI